MLYFEETSCAEYYKVRKLYHGVPVRFYGISDVNDPLYSVCRCSLVATIVEYFCDIVLVLLFLIKNK